MALVVAINVIQSLIFGKDNILINEKIGYWFVANMIFNAAWIFSWQYSARGNIAALWVALVLIIGILITLAVMYVRVNVHYLETAKSKIKKRFWSNHECNLWEFWIIQPMISIYMAWLSVATTVNFAVAFTYQFPSSDKTLFGWSHTSWACFLEGVVLCLALTFLALRRDYFFAGVISWALYAIYDQHRTLDVINSTCALLCASVCLFALVLTIIVTAVEYFKKHGGLKGTGKHVKKSARKSFSYIVEGQWKQCFVKKVQQTV